MLSGGTGHREWKQRAYDRVLRNRAARVWEQGKALPARCKASRVRHHACDRCAEVPQQETGFNAVRIPRALEVQSGEFIGTSLWNPNKRIPLLFFWFALLEIDG